MREFCQTYFTLLTGVFRGENPCLCWLSDVAGCYITDNGVIPERAKSAAQQNVLDSRKAILDYS